MDRISGLPEEVLTHILSFLETRQAVQTSILSKRWTHLWTSIPTLRFDCVIKPPTAFSLCGPKTLHLTNFICEDNSSLGKLISSCPFLEDLKLYNCGFHSLNISSNTLKKLVIDSCGRKGKSKIQVSVPSLLSFQYKPRGGQHCSLDDLVSLVDAFFIIDELQDLSDGNATLCGMLRGICNATSLRLSYVSREPYVVGGIQDDDSGWTPKEISPPFLIHLREITIRDFKSTALREKFVKFLLEHAKSVKEITIIPEETL